MRKAWAASRVAEPPTCSPYGAMHRGRHEPSHPGEVLEFLPLRCQSGMGWREVPAKHMNGMGLRVRRARRSASCHESGLGPPTLLRRSEGPPTDDRRQMEPESGRQRKRAASGRAHVVERTEEIRRRQGVACCRSAAKDQEYQCSERRRPNQAGALGFKNLEYFRSADSKLCRIGIAIS